jgi:sec-independent protein translocase protein TatA
MLGNLNGPTLVVILFIVLLLFGAPKLPGLAKSLGQSMRILKKEVRNDDADATAKGNGPAGAAPEAPKNETPRTGPRDPGDDPTPGDRP